jgi:putative hydrolase of the HAD superfamily
LTILPLPPPELPPELERLIYPGPEKRRLGEIRVLLFDVYGTLFTSGGRRSDQPIPEIGGYTGEELRTYFCAAVRRSHKEKYAENAWPEVRVDEIWAAFINTRKGPVMEPRELALRYELASNPVFPMPGALGTIKKLKARGISLGIVSNAQFFTPLLFEAFFGASPEGLGFDPALIGYSYITGEAKPSPVLLSGILEGLTARGIPRNSCLCVGNDLLNDILPASFLGCKTLLFAGDGGSLQLREGHPLVRHLLPTGVIRNLEELPGICGP